MITYMAEVHEELLHYIWKKRLIRGSSLETVHGEEIRVIEPGEQNFHAGPDFINARIRIGNLEWAGNVEIHMKTSLWSNHGHHQDPAYDNVILHVVKQHDAEITNSRGRRIPTLVIPVPENLLHLYEELRAEEGWLPCHPYIRNVQPNILQQWYRQLNAMRFRVKRERITTLLNQNGFNKEETLYRALASGFGLPINSLPFELVAAGIPYRYMNEIRHSLADLEALLFGQSGFLNSGINQTPYVKKLREIYRLREGSFTTKPLPVHLWKFLRLRPASFPTLRLSQFASLLHRRIPLSVSLLSFSNLSELEQLLRVRASEYWDTHYIFGKCSPDSVKFIGRQSIHSLIINVVVPFLYSVGKTEVNGFTLKRARELLIDLEAESNQIIKNWHKFGLKPVNAFESQALIQLHHNFCEQKRCMDCMIGTTIMTGSIDEK